MTKNNNGIYFYYLNLNVIVLTYKNIKIFFTTHRHTKGRVPEASTTCSNIFRSNSGGTVSPQTPLFSATSISVSTRAGRWLLDLFDFLRSECFPPTSDTCLFDDCVNFLDQIIYHIRKIMYIFVSVTIYIHR